jgi:hypothetical protein
MICRALPTGAPDCDGDLRAQQVSEFFTLLQGRPGPETRKRLIILIIPSAAQRLLVHFMRGDRQARLSGWRPDARDGKAWERKPRT